MKKRIPLFIVFLVGMLMIIQFFIPHRLSVTFYTGFLNWFTAMVLFALIIGIGTLLNRHFKKIKRKDNDWVFSIVTITGFFGMLLIGIFGGIGEGTLFMKLFEFVLTPLQATMFALLAFFIASAAFRAFRARTFEASLLLVAALIVMLGRVPIGDKLTFGLASTLTEWIFRIPNMAAKRGIQMGIALGMIATSLKIIFGIERSWLGSDD